MSEDPLYIIDHEYNFINTVKPHLSRPHLYRLFTYPDKCLGTIDSYIIEKGLTYPEIQLSGQSSWERRCSDK